MYYTSKVRFIPPKSCYCIATYADISYKSARTLFSFVSTERYSLFSRLFLFFFRSFFPFSRGCSRFALSETAARKSKNKVSFCSLTACETVKIQPTVYPFSLVHPLSCPATTAFLISMRYFSFHIHLAATFVSKEFILVHFSRSLLLSVCFSSFFFSFFLSPRVALARLALSLGARLYELGRGVRV